MAKPYGTHGSTETDYDCPKFRAACDRAALQKSAQIDSSPAAKASRAVLLAKINSMQARLDDFQIGKKR